MENKKKSRSEFLCKKCLLKVRKIDMETKRNQRSLIASRKLETKKEE